MPNGSDATVMGINGKPHVFKSALIGMPYEDRSPNGGRFDTAPGAGITGQDPLLGPLQDNGGPTFTHALLAGSPAIDAGNDGAAPATDQRGTSRPQGLFSDIGAFEVIVATAVPVPGLTTWGMAALALGLGALVLVARRRRAAFLR